MSAALLGWSVLVAQLMLAVAMGCAVLRVLIGPRAQDRVLALDTLYVNAAMLLLVFGIRTGSTHYFEAALLITLLGFVATAALSKFLMRGEVIE
jgi:multicomponent K+:H+ antiporter subunit F